MRYVNIILMAGEGKRFLSNKANLPKPLILINKIPMVFRVTNSLPKADLWIFICRENHILNYSIDKLLKKRFMNSIIISVKKTTKGQASTCLMAREFLKNDDCVFIYSCDTCLFFNHKKLFDVTKNSDAVVITGKPNKFAMKNPNQFGWVASKGNNVNEISCKDKLISSKNGHVILGSFGFSRASLMIELINEIIINKKLVKGEFYLDTAIQNALGKNNILYDFYINKYISFGTPDEIKLFENIKNV